ncbi:MAG: hypothetical protein HUU22_18395 [Phycisphaerae bacterium]|nr:hypothetical protein [Phycisphaerae bacterium]NUQ47987.1 hypothetical protein [Phycisphaerae bacterium]
MSDLPVQAVGSSASAAGWQFFVWGVVGGFVVDGLGYVRLMREGPPESRPTFGAALLLAEAVRLLVGGLLALAFGLAGEIAAPVGAMIVGITAPIIVEKYLESPPLIQPGG